MSASIVLMPNLLGGASSIQADLSRMGASWRRTINLQWGPGVGTFAIEGSEAELARYMHQWLGYHLEERSGRVTWEGIVVDLTLHSRVVRRRSLENVWNRVAVGYDNGVRNGGFEQWLSATEPEYWGQSTAGAWSSEETSNVGTGDSSLQLDFNSPERYMRQQMYNFEPNKEYKLTFQSAGDGSVDGRYSVYDDTNGADIIATASTGNTGTSYQRTEITFITPAGCTEVEIRLYTPSGSGSVYYDQVEIRPISGRPSKLATLKQGAVFESLGDVEEEGRAKPRENGTLGQFLTPWQESQQSIDRYGTKEMIVDGGEHGYDLLSGEAPLRDTFWAAHIWPRLKRLSQAGREGTAVLEGVAVGYGHTLDWLYSSEEGNGSFQYVSDYVAAQFGEGEYIANVTVESNSQEVFPKDGRLRIKERIEEALTNAAADFQTPWHVYVAIGRRGLLKPVSFSPKYYLQKGELRNSLNGPIVNPYLVVPGVVRDVAYPSGADDPDSPYEDARDFFMSEVVVDNGSLSWGVGDF